MRSRAEEAITCIEYIQSFAMCTDLAELPELFQDGSRLPQAAVNHVLFCKPTCLGPSACMIDTCFNAGYVRAAPLFGSGRQRLKRESCFTKQAAFRHTQKGAVCVPNQVSAHAKHPVATLKAHASLMRCMQGSIEHAASQLEAYRALLEKDVIASFDKAVHQKDLGTMAECAQVMTQFERGDSALMQVCQGNLDRPCNNPEPI